MAAQYTVPRSGDRGVEAGVVCGYGLRPFTPEPALDTPTATPPESTAGALVTPSRPLSQAGYQRTFEAQLDYLGDRLMRVTGTHRDAEVAIRYVWEVRVPHYEIERATAEHLAGPTERLDPELADRAGGIAGAHASQGFSRALRTALGDAPGSREHLALGVDMARVSLQGLPVPPGDHERFADLAKNAQYPSSRVARMAWERDRADWGDVCNSCFAYRDESAAVFDAKEIECFDLALVSPEPGQEEFFRRSKTMNIVPDSGRYVCTHRMHDTFHELGVAITLDDQGNVADAGNDWRRLAFHGLCEGGQSGPPTLIGRQLDAGYARVLADHVGGRTGCSHLFDLSVDCLRFFDWA